MPEMQNELSPAARSFAATLPAEEAAAWTCLAGEMSRYEPPCFQPDASPHELSSAYGILEPNREITRLGARLRGLADAQQRRVICEQITHTFEDGSLLHRSGIEQLPRGCSKVDMVVIARDVTQSAEVVLPAMIELGDREQALRLYDDLRRVEESLRRRPYDFSQYAEVLGKFLSARLADCSLFSGADALNLGNCLPARS